MTGKGVSSDWNEYVKSIFLSCRFSVTQSEGRFEFLEPNAHETLCFGVRCR